MGTAVSNIDQIRTQLTAMQPQFAMALPKHVNPEKFIRVVMTAIQTTPSLLEADRRTLFGAAMRASQMGLLPDGREGAIVTFKNQAQFMPMVAGIMKMVRNSGEISTWSVQAVYDNDSFDFALGDDEHITHKPALSNRGKIIAVYSIVTMKDGEKSREVMSVEDVEAIRKRSRSGQAGPWVSDFSEMAKKTVVRRHSKRLPMSTDLDDALRSDDELFMPSETPTAVSTGAIVDHEDQSGSKSAKVPTKRASRLQKVAEQAPETPSHDEDGVIDQDAEVTYSTDEEYSDDSDDSPI